MVSADDYGIDFTGATDVRVALAAAINAQSPGTTFNLHADGLYLTTGDAATSNIDITAPQVTIDGLGASIFRNVRRTALGSTGRFEDILTINASNVTVRNLKIYGFRKDEYLGSVLTTVTGTPTVNGTTIELNALNEEVRLPKVGLDLDQADNTLPDNPSSTHPHPATNYETPFYFRQVDGLLKFEAVLSDSNQVTSDCVFAIVNDLTDAVIYSQTYTLTGTPTLKTITFDPTPNYLGIPMRITVRKATATANTITVTSITPYGEIGYRDRDGQFTYGYFTGGNEFSDAIQVNAVSGTLLEDIEIEGPDGDCVNCASSDSNTVIRRITGRGCGRQGGVIHKGVNTLIEDCTFRETGRSGLDLEPNNVADLMSDGTIRRIEFINIRNYAMSMRHWAKILDFTIDDITITNAGMGPWYGGGRNMVATNIVHSGTTRTEADRIDNGGVDPALNGGVGADAQIFGSNMDVVGFTTEYGFQLPIITNTYNDGGGVVTYSPDDIHITEAAVNNPYTTNYVYIAAPNSSVEFASLENAFQVGEGFFIDSTPTLYDLEVEPDVISGSTITLPGFTSVATAFQTDAFQDDAFQQSAASEGLYYAPTLFAPSLGTTGQTIYLTGTGGWDSDEIVWDDATHYWDEPNVGGFIDQAGHVFPLVSVGFIVTLPVIAQTPVLYDLSVGGTSFQLPFINNAGFTYTPQQVTQTVSIDDPPSYTQVFTPYVSYAQEVDLDLIDQTPVLYEFQIGQKAISLPFINRAGFTFAPVQFTFTVTLPLINQAPVLYPPVFQSVELPLIDQSGVVFDLTVVHNADDITLEFIDNSGVVYEPVRFNVPFGQDVRLNDDADGFIDQTGVIYDLIDIETAPPQNIFLGLIDQEGVTLQLRVLAQTTPIIVLHARYDPVSLKHARYDPVTFKHAQNTRQGG